MPTYSIAGPDGKTYSIDGPEGATREQVIQAIQSRMTAQVAPPAPSTERTGGDVVKDIAASAATGIGGLLSFPGQIVKLIPGLQQAGEALETPGEYLTKFGEDLKSAGLKAREALRSQALSEAEKEGVLSQFATAITSTIKDPALLSSFFVEQLPLLLGPAGAAKVAQKIGARGIEAAGAGLTGRAAEEAVTAATQRVGRQATGAAIGTGAAMQAGDISSDTYTAAYQRALQQGMSPDEANAEALNAARLAGAGAAGISALTGFGLGKLFPSTAAIERRMAGLPGAGRLPSVIGEASSESLEEAGGQIFRNVGIRTIDPTQSLTEGVGAAAGLGALGGGFFGGLLGKKPPAELAPGQLPGETLYQTAERLNKQIADIDDAFKTVETTQKPRYLSSAEIVDMYRTQGYGAVKQYQNTLETERQDQSLTKEERKAANEQARDVQDFLSQVTLEEAQRTAQSFTQNLLGDREIHRGMGIPRSDPIYKTLLNKDLGKPEDADAVVTALEGALQRKGLRLTQYERFATALENINQYLSTIPGSGFYAQPSVEPTGREGAGVAGVAGERPAAERVDQVKQPRVVRPTEVVGEPPRGEAAEPAALTPEAPAEAPVVAPAAEAPKVAPPAAKAPKVAPPTPPTRTTAPIAPTAAASLPKELAGAKPRYAYGPKQFQLEFASDIDKALFITAQKTPSKRDADYRAWLQTQGFTPEQISTQGSAVRQNIKEMAAVSEPKQGPLKVKPVKRSLKAEDRTAEVLRVLEGLEKSKTEEKAAEVLKEAEKSDKQLLTEQRAELIKQLDGILKRILAKYGLKGVKLDLKEAFDSEGSYQRQLITLALNVDSPVRVLRHESIHALKDMGFFTPDQWRVLQKRAKDEWIGNLKNIKHSDTQSRYDAYVEIFNQEAKDKGLTGDEAAKYVEEAVIEEAIADAFGVYEETKAPPGLMNAILNRMNKLFKAIKEAFNVAGIESAEDIFGKIEKGQLKPILKPTEEVVSPEEAKTEREDEIRPTKFAVRPSDRGDEVGREVRTREAGDRGRRDQGRGIAPLAGAPIIQGATGPDPELVDVARRYAEDNGIPFRRQAVYVKADVDRARRIADAYDQMAHAPEDPRVQEAYQDLINQTRKQYDALIEAGYEFTFFDSETDPYGGNPFNAMRDLRNNKRMAVYGTYDGYGTEGITGAAIEQNPMLEDTGLRWEDQNGVERMVTANDLFRAVHDAFGHGLEGAGFRADGEENAWQAHVRLFKGPAVGAITSETRGQNSWLNFGPYGEKNRTAKLEDTVFAEQKTGLMPDWTWNEGIAPDEEANFSLRPALVLGTKQPDASEYQGIHYGLNKVDVLSGFKYGSGIKGAERKRLENSFDDRIRRRVYFYIQTPEGQIPSPEAGLGNYVYTQTFGNILGPGEEMQRLNIQANRDPNEFESAVIDAGYDGYAVPSMGIMVVLNHDVPVNYEGTREEYNQSKIKRSLRNSIFSKQLNKIDINSVDDFWRVWQNFMIGTAGPRGTASSILDTESRENRIKQAVSVWKKDVQQYGIKKYLMSYEDNKGQDLQLDDVVKSNIARQIFTSAGIKPTLKNILFAYNSLPGQVIAANDVDQILSAPNYTGEILNERFRRPLKGKDFYGNELVETEAVNETKFSIRAPDTKEFKQWFGKSKIVNADGTPKVMYHGTSRDITKFRPKQAGAIFVTDDPKFAEEFGSASEDYMAKELFNNATPEQRKQWMINAANIALQNKKITQKDVKELKQDLNEVDFTFGFVPSYIEAETIQILINQLPSRANIIPVFVSSKNPFDYENEDHINQLKKYEEARRYTDDSISNSIGFVKLGSWEAIESEKIQKAIKSLGFDGFYVKEGFWKNLAVYSPDQVKSAIGNIGAYGQRPITAEEAERLGMTEEEAQAAQAEGDIRLSLRSQTAWTDKRIDSLLNDFAYTQSSREGDAKAYAARITPRDFLNATADTELEKIILEETKPLSKEELAKADSIFLEIRKEGDGDYQIVGHEGRHRMMALANAGYDRGVPVVLVNRPYGAVQNAEPIEEAYLRRQLFDNRIGRKGIYVPLMVPISWKYEQDLREQFSGEAEVKFSLRSLVSNAMTPSVTKTVNKIAPPTYNPNLWEKILNAVSGDSFTKIRTEIINRYERLASYDRAVAKQIKQAGGVQQLADQRAESAALFSDLGAGLLETAMGANDKFGGVPVFRNGITVIDNFNRTIKGPILIVKPLADLKDPEVFRLWQVWKSVQRGKRLDVEGRENLIDAPDIKAIERMERQNKNLIKIFKMVDKDWTAYNDKLVQYMVDTGVISKAMAQEWTKHGDYFPFYRLMDLNDVQGPKMFSSLANVRPPKKLKGGEEPLGDFFENIVRNSQAAIQAGIKNVAAQRATEQALKLQQVVRLPKAQSGANVYRVMENGKEVYYESADPLFVDAIKSLNMPDLPFIGILSGPANILRNLVTKDPAFMLANMMRDSMAAWVTSGVKMTPIIDTARNFALAIANKSPETQRLYAAGVLGGYDYARGVKTSAEDFRKRLRALSNTKTPTEKLLTPFTSLWGALEKGTQASDAATRAEVYKRVLAETGSEAEAYWQALEIMNFNRRGRSPVIRVLTAAIPFLNARMQGLDLLFRTAIYPVGGGSTDQAIQRMKTFWVRGMTLMALSGMYWLLTHDDDEYKKQEKEVRDEYWLIPSLGIKLPIPFEIGIMFKVIPERIAELTFGSDTNKDFTQAMKRQFVNTFGIGGPQVAKPLIEVSTNHNFYTDRPIIGKGLEDVAAPYQVGPSTSRVAEAIGKAVGYSPMKVDHLIKGYTGTMGTYAVDLFDMIFDMTDRPQKASKRFEQMPVIKRFALDPEARGTVTAYYEFKDRVDEIVRTTNLLQRSMNYEEYGKYMQDNLQTLAFKGYVNSLERTMKDYREMKAVVMSTQMDPDQKRDTLISIGRMESALTRNIQTIKKVAE